MITPGVKAAKIDKIGCRNGYSCTDMVILSEVLGLFNWEEITCSQAQMRELQINPDLKGFGGKEEGGEASAWRPPPPRDLGTRR